MQNSEHDQPISETSSQKEEDQLSEPSHHPLFEERDEEDLLPKKTPFKESRLSNVNLPASKSITSSILKEPQNLLSSHKKHLVPQIPKSKPPTKRLIIKEITLENFKSYQGKQTIGPFHKRFTSVVGPNGSGKSNLIESLLFVFGKRASWMRLNKLYELIHNSSGHQNNKRASVEVHFCEIIDKDDEEFEIVPNSDFSVRRVVHHTSVSNYEINDVEANQKQVVELLQSKGIDLTNHRFLILQGEVEQISLMKPKTGKQDDPGLLEYLEDIVGSYVYKEKIDALEEEYFKLYEKKREKNDLVNISKLELVKLEAAKNIAVEYVRKEKQIYQLMNITHQIARHKANKELMKAESMLDEALVKKKEEERKFKERMKDKESFLKSFKKRKQDLEEITDRIATLDNKIKECEKKDIQINKDMEHLLGVEVKYAEQIKDLEKKYNKIIENASEIKKSLPDKKDRLSKLQEQREVEEQKLNDMMADLNKRAEKYRIQKKEIESRLEPYHKSLSSLKNEVTMLSNELNFLQNNSSNYTQDLNDLHTRSQALIAKSQDIEATFNAIDQAFARMKDIKHEMSAALDAAKKDEDVLMREISEIQARLDESKSSANEQHQRNHMLNVLMKAQQTRELTGIHGRLGDLGFIDEKYDVAITSSCPALENIVVSRIEDAVKAVEYLRTNKVGRATFISLEKSKENYRPGNFQAPRGTARLFDLVKMKNEDYKPVFYSALRDTLVCEDIDQATQIAYGTPRYRVVVTNGVVIETTGAMSGGGKPRKGGMASKSSKEGLSLEQIADLTEKKRVRVQELEEVRRKRASCEAELATVVKDENQAVKERKKYETEYEFLNQQIKENDAKSKEIIRIRDSRVKDGDKKRELERKIQEKQAEIQKIEDKMIPAHEERAKIEQRIAEYGGDSLKNQQKVAEEVIKAHENLEKEVSKLSANLESTQGNLERNEAEKSKAEKQLESAKEKLSELKKAREELEEETLKTMGHKASSIEKQKLIEQEYERDNAEKEQLENLLNELRKSLAKFNDQIEENKQALKKAKEDYNRENGDLEKIRKGYTEATANYDFLNDLDEIESYHISEAQGNNNSFSNSINESMLEMSILIPGMNMNNDDEDQPKKKVKVALSTQTIESIDVAQDLTMDQLDNTEKLADRLKMKIAAEQEKFKGMSPNITSISEFRNKFIEHKGKNEELEKARMQIDELKNQVDVLKKTRFDEFMAGFNQINCKLKETYQLLTNGGDAELELIDTFDPFAEGVSFSVRPPKKSWKQMTKLSGGEKTLSSLALVFALHYFKPTPLYFMDEIDAALDFKNVAIVAKYIKERTKDAQFIIISLRNNMFELANKLVGVYKTFDTTKTIAIIPGLFPQLVAEKVA